MYSLYVPNPHYHSKGNVLPWLETSIKMKNCPPGQHFLIFDRHMQEGNGKNMIGSFKKYQPINIVSLSLSYTPMCHWGGKRRSRFSQAENTATKKNVLWGNPRSDSKSMRRTGLWWLRRSYWPLDSYILLRWTSYLTPKTATHPPLHRPQNTRCNLLKSPSLSYMSAQASRLVSFCLTMLQAS